jgi:hypothetical protein
MRHPSRRTAHSGPAPDTPDAEELRVEISALFSAFLPPELAQRFTGLLALQPRRWHKIDPWRVWDHVDSAAIAEWPGSVQDLLVAPPYARYAQAGVAVLRCGHEAPGLARQPLHEALRGKSQVFEGFISVHPGQLGIAINHDGMLCTLRR